MITTILFSFFSGFAVFYLIHKIKTQGFEKLGEEILKNFERKAREKEEKHELSLKQKELHFFQEIEKMKQESIQKIGKDKARLEKREDFLDEQKSLLEKKLIALYENTQKCEEEKTFFQKKNQSLQEKELFLLSEMERLSLMTNREAKDFLIKKNESEIRDEMGKLSIRLKKETEEEAEIFSKKILISTMNRMVLSTVSEIATTIVFLPHDEIKKRIIGREGRNIRSLEHATGVNFIVDDTPNAIVISSFDPLRREIAKLTLKELIRDGRIHPTRIEEVALLQKEILSKQIEDLGKESATKAEVYNLHPELLKLLGQLHFQYILGQNALSHSLEVCFLMGMMAAELELDVKLAKRIGLLHDIGKSSPHHVEKSHALIGYDLAQKYGEKEEVALGIGCHHDEMAPSTIEASLIHIANKISGGRPGARIESLDHYIKRAHKLEALASQFVGVEKAYALQTGKEVRIIVEPERFDDVGASLLAKDIARKIEKELSYPGKIKITVIREKRIIEYAS